MRQSYDRPYYNRPEHVSAKLREALDALEHSFCIAGEIPLEAENKQITLFFADGTGEAQAVAFPLASPTAITPWLEACNQAPFERGQQSVLDPE